MAAGMRGWTACAGITGALPQPISRPSGSSSDRGGTSSAMRPGSRPSRTTPSPPSVPKNEANSPKWNDIKKFQWYQNPDCGYIEQLVRSNANAVLVTPVPDGLTASEPRYGVLRKYGELAAKSGAGKPPYHKGLRMLLDSLRRALLRSVHRELWRIDRAKVAVGGFSAGAVDAASIVLINKKTVDQLYGTHPAPSSRG